MRYINGLYDFLDELAHRHPGLVLDNCASGGRRLDFEMMRRCVVLWRSDSCWDAKTYPRNVQAMTYGLSLWLPLHGLGAAATDAVALRSGLGACASFAMNFRDLRSVADLRDIIWGTAIAGFVYAGLAIFGKSSVFGFCPWLRIGRVGGGFGRNPS